MATVINLSPVAKRPPIVTKSNVITAPNFSDIPVRTLCQQCWKPVLSQIKPTVG